MTKGNSNNGNETKSDIFHGAYSNMTSFFVGPKILKYFNDFFSSKMSYNSSEGKMSFV